MERIKSLMAIMIIAIVAVVLTGCPNDDDDDDNVVSKAPILSITPTFTGTSTDVWRGEQVNFDITCAVNTLTQSKLVDLVVNIAFNSSGKNSDDTTFNIDASSYQANYGYTVPMTILDGEIITIKFSLTAKDGELKNKNYVLNCVDPADVSTYYDTLGAQSNPDYGSSFSTSTGEVFLVAEAKTNQSKVDFIYIFDNKGSSPRPYTATLAAPSNTEMFGTNNASQYPVFDVHTWTVQNETYFKQIPEGTISKNEFDNLTSNQIQGHYSNSSSTPKDIALFLHDANGYPSPSVYVFKTSKNKYGMFMVNHVGGYDPAGYMVLTVKVQK